MALAGRDIISIRQLRFIYDDGTEALRGVDLEIGMGECVGLAGPNGSGKTTLCKHLNGLLRPSEGSVILAGQDIHGMRVSDLSRRVGLLFQNPDHQIFSGTVEEEISFGVRNLGAPPASVRERVAKYLKLLGLEPYARTPPLTLSLGLRRLVSMASVLAMEQEVLVLDEPTAWLDYAQAKNALRAIKEASEAGRTVLIVTHDMKLMAELTERLVIMSEGRVVADGPTSELLSEASHIERWRLISTPVARLMARLRPTIQVGGVVRPADLVSVIREGHEGGARHPPG